MQLSGRNRLHFGLGLTQAGDGVLRHPRLQVQACRGPSFEAAFDHVDFLEPELPVPGRYDCGPGLPVANKDNGAILYHQHVIGTLHHLAAGEPPESRDVARHVLFGSAHVNEVGGVCKPVIQHPLYSGNIKVAHPVLGREFVGVCLCRRQTFG